MDNLLSEYPCRNQQISLLSEFFLYPECSAPDVFYVYGPHSTGKTAVVNRLLSLFDWVKHAHVNCIETYTNRLLFESVLLQLYQDDTQRVCTNISMFLNYLGMFYNHLMQQPHNSTSHIVIVVDRCEYLSGDKMEVLSSLRHLSGIPYLSVIFISHLTPDSFYIPAINVHFPQYTKDELLTILMKGKPESTPSQFYLNYLKAALSIFLRATRDLSEMSHMVGSNFVKYCEPMEKGGKDKEDAMILWRNIMPHLKASLLSTYSGTSSLIDKSTTNRKDKPTEAKALVSFDLPYYSKYLLIAAYLASYNSAKYDRRLYLKNHGKKRKRKGPVHKESTELLGPRTFPLNRLLAIFYSILDDKPNLTAILLSQISSLVELKLMMQISDCVLDRPVYKCMANYHIVDSIAKTVEFNISKFMMS